VPVLAALPGGRAVSSAVQQRRGDESSRGEYRAGAADHIPEYL